MGQDTITFKFTIGSANISMTDGAVIKVVTDNDYKLTLKSLRYHKKIYQPGFIETKLLLKQNATNATTVPTRDQVVNFFKNKKVTLTQNNTDIAKDYYVYKVMPEYLRETKENNYTIPYINVTLHIYSPDHKLTLDKYCKSHVNKKLCADIIVEESNDGGILKAAGITADYSNTRFLNFLCQKSTGTTTTIEKREFIQPYLVQYNESFFDFLCRTANRCGEYLYYEDGKLYLGLKKSTSTAFVDKDNALSVCYQDADDSLVDTTTFYLDSSGKGAGSYVNYDVALMKKADEETDETKQKELIKQACPTTVPFPFYDEIPIDDFLGMNFKKDSFSSFKDEMWNGWSELVNLVNSLLNMSTPTKMIAKLTTKYASAVISAQGAVIEANKKGNEDWVKEKDGDGKNLHASEQYDASTKEATLYGSMMSDSDQKQNYDFQQNLNAKFYQFVGKGCRSVSSQLISINMGSEQTPLLLGEEVALDQTTVNATTAKDKYIVTEVSEVLMREDAQEDLADWQLGQRITIAPYYTKTVMKDTTEVELTMPCPPVVLPFAKKTGPQRAYVAETEDPEGLGRICIRYPWQNKDDVSSPWIRMAVPFAPNDSTRRGGILFLPDEGDEVLVDYENGNVEHPYVIGSLYTGRAKAPKKGRAIVSKRGHGIVMNDEDALSDFMAGVLPPLEMVQKYAGMMGFGSSLNFGDNNNFCGGVTISDSWGIYKIAASATQRNITIKSPFGDISIGALSGIEISAPNGDVTIKGKNVTIEAGNEVSIVSGKFINEKELTAKSFFSDYAKELAGGLVDDLVAPFTDFSILRTVWEALLKPVAGTMTIQSGRYLLLNAGGAKAEIPNKGYSVSGLLNQEEQSVDKVKLASTIRKIEPFVDNSVSSIWSLYSLVKDAIVAYSPSDSKHDAIKCAEVLNNAYDGKVYKIKQFRFKHGVSHADKVAIRDCANALKAAVITLKTEADKIKAGDAINVKDKKIFGQELHDVIGTCLPDIIKNICEGSDKQFNKTEGDFNGVKTAFKRMLFDKTNEKAKVLLQDPPKGKTSVTFGALTDYGDVAKWSDYISYLDDYATVKKKQSLISSIASAVKDQLTENIPIAGWSDERKLWDTSKNGEILMADKGQNETLNIVNGALNRTANTDDYLEGVKDQLRNI